MTSDLTYAILCDLRDAPRAIRKNVVVGATEIMHRSHDETYSAWIAGILATFGFVVQ